MSATLAGVFKRHFYTIYCMHLIFEIHIEYVSALFELQAHVCACVCVCVRVCDAKCT